MKIWTDDRYSVNNVEIDTQHKKIIEIINSIYTMIIDNCENIDSLLLELILYTRYHFKTEEKILLLHINTDMRQSIIDHIKHHHEFIDNVMDIIKDKIDNKDVKVDLAILLNDWLYNHVEMEDVVIFRKIDSM